jgi:hypothetical protein
LPKVAESSAQITGALFSLQVVVVLAPVTAKRNLAVVAEELDEGTAVNLTVGAPRLGLAAGLTAVGVTTTVGGATTTVVAVTVKLAVADLEPPGPLTVTTNVWTPTPKLERTADSVPQATPAPSSVHAIVLMGPPLVM